MIDDYEPMDREHRLCLARGRLTSLCNYMGEVLGEVVEPIAVEWRDDGPPLALFHLVDRVCPAVEMTGNQMQEAEQLARSVMLAIKQRPRARSGAGALYRLVGPPLDVTLTRLEIGQLLVVLEEVEDLVRVRAVDKTGATVEGTLPRSVVEPWLL